jgi:cytochrome c-type biogenesis protein CcmH/NrfG
MVAYMQIGPARPPGWSYNPSSWPQRWILIALGFAGLVVSRYLGAFQLGYIDGVWDPFFGFAGGTEPILNSQVQLEQQAWGRARATAEAACTAYPNAVAAWTYLAEARARGGDPESARAALAEAERRNPDYERLALVRGLLAEGDAPR